jgi:hypothetical protein
MILQVIALVPILALNLVSSSTNAEVSAIPPSGAHPVLNNCLHSPIHLPPNHQPFPCLAISSSSPSDLSALLSSALHFPNVIQNT